MSIEGLTVNTNVGLAIQKSILPKRERVDFATVLADVVKSTQNKIEIEPDKFYKLGTYNGKPVDIRIFSDGGFETTASPCLPHHRDEGPRPVTPEEIRIAEIFCSYSAAEHWAINRDAEIFHSLFLTTTGGRWTVELFNALLHQRGRTISDVKKVLEQMGLDPNTEFTINNFRFQLTDQGLKRVVT